MTFLEGCNVYQHGSMEGLSVEITARKGNTKSLLWKFRHDFNCSSVFVFYLPVVGRFMRYSAEFTDRCKSLNTGEVRFVYRLGQGIPSPTQGTQTAFESPNKITDSSRLYLVHSSTVLISFSLCKKVNIVQPKLIFSTYERRKFFQLNPPVDSLINAPLTVEKQGPCFEVQKLNSSLQPFNQVHSDSMSK